MKVAVLGSGIVGQALASGFARHGHEVKLGTREPGSEKVQEWRAKAGSNASAGTSAEAAAFADLVVIATVWGGTENAIQAADPKNFAGKVVIDVTNPLVFVPNQPPSLSPAHTDSAGEQVQRWLPDAHVVKAFNIVSFGNMVDPNFEGGRADMFIAGNDADAKKTVTEILTSFGWNTIDVGNIEGARLLEQLAMLWIVHGFRTGKWNHAFKLVYS